ncbi:hypothetical protein SAICODRAFT_193247 [Saitoella complicata NRRL Y-17804]|uniref:uncharacterized protein n=1 Tax=Saitoella complicata (strain BCRC 22490 / CBS 7301 / JCM 7358 / NBRC 10748 / NRRL Y-17804) TaxID=698492 RepID=UPI0008670F0A|nr:uncharacterized protein SAICODRAFT_193247 [Saitoella complicata NRRL Y-17804]ODQ49735.1 hypothetical protein SAICODRAFT_193247 [Saitoella complicata NRRL Y-17804]
MSSKQIGGANNGQTRNIAASKAPKFYPAEDISAAKATRKTARPAKVRSTLKAGAVLILLAGRFRGKRVVLLKTLADGTLLVTGPFKINGVPLRRVNAAYVIATSTSVDVSAVDVAKFDEAYFKREKKSASKKGTEAEFFGEGAKKQVSESRVADQKAVDKAILEAVNKTSNLKSYLASSFSLNKGDRPHLMKF